MINFFKDLLPPWAFIIIVLGITFLIITRNSWNLVVQEAAIRIKNKFFSFNRKGERQKDTKSKNSVETKKLKSLYKNLGIKNIDEIYSIFEKSKKSVEETTSQKNQMFFLWKTYMFSFFNLFLVPRSKVALIWLYNNPNVTKEMFCLNMSFPLEFENKEMEREAVFSALINHTLIEKNPNDLYKVSNIGNDYLKFSGFIKNEPI